MTPLDLRLLRYARATVALLGAAVALGCLTAALAVALAVLLADVVSRVAAGAAGLDAVGGSLATLAAVLVSRPVVQWAQDSIAQRASASAKSALRRRILERAIDLGPDSPDAPRRGAIVALTTHGLDGLDAYFGRYLPQLVLALVLPFAVVVALLSADFVAALTVALTVPLIPIFMALVGRAAEIRRTRRWSAMARLSHHFLDVVTGLETLRIHGRSRVQVERLRDVTDAYRLESIGTLRVAFLSAFVLELIATLSVALVAVGVGLRLVDGALDLRTGLFVLVLTPEAYLPLRKLGADYHASEAGLAAASAAFDIIEAPLPLVGSRTDVPWDGDGAWGSAGGSTAGGRITVEAVTVEQPGRGVAAPDGASFTVRPGEIVALAGPSGAGKTTLLHVIVGLRRPTAGRVVVHGADGGSAPIDELAPEAWRRHLAWVPQEPFFLAGSVLDNVRLIAPAASEIDVRRALDGVGLRGIALSRRLGEQGSGLSTGQRRRIAIARALLRDARVLLLDEPTAGLDSGAESAVLAAIRDAASRRSIAVVLVAHRPGALAVADRVVAIESRTVAA